MEKLQAGKKLNISGTRLPDFLGRSPLFSRVNYVNDVVRRASAWKAVPLSSSFPIRCMKVAFLFWLLPRSKT